MQTNKNYIEEIVAKHLVGEASYEEVGILEDWLKEPANEAEYKELIKTWNDATSATILHQFNVQAAWEKVNTKIAAKHNSTEEKIISINKYKKVLTLAASLIFITVSIFYFYTGISSGPVAMKNITASINQKILLTDGSTIHLRKGSTLKYPEKFEGNIRRVEMKGEAYFEIMHDETKPFEVTTPKALIQDLGTAFMVRTTDSIEEIYVTEGKVSFSTKEPGEPIVLIPGEKALIKEGDIYREIVDNQNFLSWQTHKLIFNNTPIQEVIIELSRLYNEVIKISEDLTNNTILITAEYSQQTLNEVLEELQMTTGLTIKKHNNEYIISR